MPRFALDRMLIKLGTYLRILGYDSIWDPVLRIHDLIRVADTEGRVLLTCNKHLGSQFPTPKQWLLVPSTTPLDQLRYVIASMRLDTHSGLFSRCVKCNAPNQRIHDKRTVRGVVPEPVWLRFKTFTRCPVCGSVYWFGTHVRNTSATLGLILRSEDSTAGGASAELGGCGESEQAHKEKHS